MNCPWCGKEMQTGRLIFGGRALLYEPLWKADGEKYGLLDHLLCEDGVIVTGMDISGFDRTKIRADHCPDCKKFVIDGETTSPSL